MIWRVFQLRRWWQDLRSTEECGKWFTVSGDHDKFCSRRDPHYCNSTRMYCTRKHNHKGDHKGVGGRSDRSA